MDINPFTFQSGYIQINIQSEETLFILTFTFQSGYIQIKMATTPNPCIYLYIPIWLYSNDIATGCALDDPDPLHSNLVIFKF